jgi:hypothetical protein
LRSVGGTEDQQHLIIAGSCTILRAATSASFTCPLTPLLTSWTRNSVLIRRLPSVSPSERCVSRESIYTPCQTTASTDYSWRYRHADSIVTRVATPATPYITSSMKMIAGRFSRATAKRALTSFSPCPTYTREGSMETDEKECYNTKTNTNINININTNTPAPSLCAPIWT